MKRENNANIFQLCCLGYQGWVGTDIVVWGKKEEEYVELELRVVFVHWTQRIEERNSSVRERERAVKETTGILDSHRDKQHHTTSFRFLLLFSLSSQSVAMSLLGVSDQCWHSQCSLLQCCLYWEISIPLIVEVCLCTEAWASILIQRPLCYAKTLSRKHSFCFRVHKTQVYSRLKEVLNLCTPCHSPYLLFKCILVK